MNKVYPKMLLATILAGLLAVSCSQTQSNSPQGQGAELQAEAQAALSDLYRITPSAKVLGEKAKAVLVFPSITKGGFVVGGQYGKGVLFKNGRASGYYSTTAASWGLQAGIQKFGYALFFMEDADLAYINQSEGWEVGVGPNITVVDKGLATSLSSTTLRSGVYAFFFEQKGLMAGLGIQGTKISRIDLG